MEPPRQNDVVSKGRVAVTGRVVQVGHALESIAVDRIGDRDREGVGPMGPRDPRLQRRGVARPAEAAAPPDQVVGWYPLDAPSEAQAEPLAGIKGPADSVQV